MIFCLPNSLLPALVQIRYFRSYNAPLALAILTTVKITFSGSKMLKGARHVYMKQISHTDPNVYIDWMTEVHCRRKLTAQRNVYVQLRFSRVRINLYKFATIPIATDMQRLYMQGSSFGSFITT